MLDKTGTLTQNKLTLGDPFSVDKIPAEQVVLCAALASRAEDKDTIDLAVLGGIKDDKELKSYQILHFLPFDPVHKRTEATVKGSDGKQFKVTKGAPQMILELSANAAQVKPAVEKAINEFAARGFRSLGVARADGSGKWQFLGVLPLFDPPREDAKATISSAVQMGVKIKMVTGDQVAIAVETAKKLGMGVNILDASGFGDAKAHETAQLAQSIENADGFAQVFPEHKFHIIDVLQKAGHIVGMTGDGVNDAPALKKADCGIAVSGATDAARAAASIVLMTPGLSVIIDAIKESRKIFQRMNSYAIYRIAETLGVLFFMTLAILIFNFYPLTAVMIVMLALLNDGAILSIAYDNVHYKDAPEAWNMHLVLGVATVVSIIGVIDSFGLFYIGDRIYHLDHALIQTLMYLKLSVAGHFKIFLTRTRGPFWSVRPARILLLAVIGTQIAATLIAVYGLFMPPIGWVWALLVWVYSLPFFLLNDRVKLLAYRILDPVKAAPQLQNTTEQKPMTNVKTKPETKADSKANVKAIPQPKAAANTEPVPATKTLGPAKPEAKTQPKSEGEGVPVAAANTEPKTDAKAKPQPEADTAPQPETTAEPETKGETSANLTPQLVKRVHEFYEELGCKEVQAVNDMEQATRKDKAAK